MVGALLVLTLLQTPPLGLLNFHSKRNAKEAPEAEVTVLVVRNNGRAVKSEAISGQFSSQLHVVKATAPPHGFV
jgi:hypothetical protein